jgi:hypothetical protein
MELADLRFLLYCFLLAVASLSSLLNSAFLSGSCFRGVWSNRTDETAEAASFSVEEPHSSETSSLTGKWLRWSGWPSNNDEVEMSGCFFAMCEFKVEFHKLT